MTLALDSLTITQPDGASFAKMNATGGIFLHGYKAPRIIAYQKGPFWHEQSLSSAALEFLFPSLVMRSDRYYGIYLNGTVRRQCTIIGQIYLDTVLKRWRRWNIIGNGCPKQITCTNFVVSSTYCCTLWSATLGGTWAVPFSGQTITGNFWVNGPIFGSKNGAADTYHGGHDGQFKIATRTFFTPDSNGTYDLKVTIAGPYPAPSVADQRDLIFTPACYIKEFLP